MEASLLVLGLIAGWCGTPAPIRFPWWRWPRPPRPEPVCPACGNLFALLGGLAATAVLQGLWPNDAGVAATILIGAVGGRLAGMLYLAFAPMPH